MKARSCFEHEHFKVHIAHFLRFLDVLFGKTILIVTKKQSDFLFGQSTQEARGSTPQVPNLKKTHTCSMSTRLIHDGMMLDLIATGCPFG